MDKFIAYCGLDCEKCEARIATINNDDNLREQVAKKWSKLNNIKITKEMINCGGCKIDGIKTIFCDKLCEIRKCSISKQYDSCKECDEKKNCNKLSMIIDHNNNAKMQIM